MSGKALSRMGFDNPVHRPVLEAEGLRKWMPRNSMATSRCGERKDIAGHQQVGIVSPNRMPVDAAVGDCELRHQIGTGDRDAILSEAAHYDPPNHPILVTDLPLIKKPAELRLLGLVRHRRRDADAKIEVPMTAGSFRESSVNTDNRIVMTPSH